MGVVGALEFDLSNDGKTNVWDLQLAVNQGKDAQWQKDALHEALGGNDELKPNANGEYEIWTALGLYNMASIVDADEGNGKTFRLMADIDLMGADWNGDLIFNGTLEGDGHVISNLIVNDDTAVNTTTYTQGFFAKVARNGKVNNLKLENITVEVQENSKAAFIGLLAGSVVGELHDCTTVGTVIDHRTTLPSATYIGTLCGRIENVPSDPVVGITMDDESILMTAETAQITAISGKSQKVLCKMGMDFAELSYPEGTESAAKYKRQLGIAGWAPNYDNFKKYNWQDISGACTTVGGTGKVYNLIDPILTERRQTAVDKMYEICTVEWTPSQNMTIYYYKVGTGDEAGKLAYSTKTWEAGKTYRGMPYNHGSGSLERFEAWMSGTDSQGRLVTKTSLPTTSYYYTYTAIRNAMSAYKDTTLQTPLTFTDPDTGKSYDLLPGFTVSDQPMILGESVASADHAGFSRYVGNDCSQAIAWAWREVVSCDVANGGTVVSGVTQMCPTTAYQALYGVVPVGGMVPTAYSVKACDELYTAKGKTGFMAAYAQASRGDALIVDQTAGGHSRMIAYDPICIRDYRGNIHETNSYLITHEQGSSSSGTENGVKWSSTCSANKVYTFETLTSDSTHGTGTNGNKCKHYFPASINAFHNVDNKAVTSTVTYSKGVVKSNFYIVSLTMDGVETFPSIGQHSSLNTTTRVGDGYRDAHIQEDLNKIYGDITGKTVTVLLSNGDTYTVNGTTGAVTKN